DKHKHTGNAEGEGGSEMPQEDRHEERGEKRAEVDDPVESIEYHFRAMLVRLVELVADKRSHTWFDPARAERDQREPDVETGAVRDKHRQKGLTHAVNQAQPQNGVVFPVEPVGQPAAQQRKKV